MALVFYLARGNNYLITKVREVRMEVCSKCGRIIEEDHKCSKIVIENEEMIKEIIKKEPREDLINHMEKLELNKGDLLLFHYDSQMDVEEIQFMGGQIVEMVQEYKEHLVPVIFLPDTFSLQSMTKQDLKMFIDDAKAVYKDMDDVEEMPKIQ